MVKKNTVIIVGAGASADFGLPLGSGLRTEVSRLLDIRFENGFRQSTGDRLLCDAIRVHQHLEHSNDINSYLKICWEIRDAMPLATSIDSYLDSHSQEENLVLLGKLAIARSILTAETSSSLYFDRSTGTTTINFDRLEDSWIAQFFRLLVQSCRFDQLADRLDSITLIVFNYDRCIEHFLIHAIRSYFRVDENDAITCLKHLSILHPYGSVGSLPWQVMPQPIEFGGTPTTNQLLEFANTIRTFAEGTSPANEQIKKIRESISQARIGLFIGFAYHRQNLQLLRVEGSSTSSDQVSYYGTGFGLSVSDCEDVRDELVGLCQRSIGHVHVRNDLKCNAIFREYFRKLSLG